MDLIVRPLTIPNMIRLIICTVAELSTRIQCTMRLAKLIGHLCRQVLDLDPLRTSVYRQFSDTHSHADFPGAPSIGWNIPPSSMYGGGHGITLISMAHAPPPLPPRNTGKYGEWPATAQEHPYQMLDRRKIGTKLYENVVIRKRYDAELVAFYNMVKHVRSQYAHDDKSTNVGHVVAAEFSNLYPEETSIKLLVHPSLECMSAERSKSSSNGGGGGGSGDTITMNNLEKGQVEGYGPPVVFTCDSESMRWCGRSVTGDNVEFVCGFVFSLHNR